MSGAGGFASRAGEKLEHALREFEVAVAGLVCADFGCNVGGFTDCLLRHDAAKVYALDTGYGTLAYRLRTDARVVAMERTNALHAPPPAQAVDLVAVDLGWTRQRHAVPAALSWIRPGGRIVSLVKPHYEAEPPARGGRLAPDAAEDVFRRVLDELPALGAAVLAHTRSPLAGAKSARRGPGNVEYLVLLAPASPPT